MENIGRKNKDDVSYRYKMPRLQCKVEGRGNGIKTVITNVTDICEALHTDVLYVTKWWGFEMASQAKFDDARQVSIVNGKHDRGALAECLEDFIEQYVLCPRCELPEIKLKVKKKMIKYTCYACGANDELASTHRLVGYIIKTAANKKGDKKDKKSKKASKKDKKDKKSKKKSKKSKDDSDPEAEAAEAPEAEAAAEAADDDSSSKKKSKKSKKKSKKSKEEVVWHTDTSVEAVEARRRAEFEEMAGEQSEHQHKIDAILNAGAEDDADESKNDPVFLLRLFLAKDPSTSAIAAEVRRIQLARGLDDSQGFRFLLEAMLSEDAKAKQVPGQLKKHTKTLAYIVRRGVGAQQLIGGIEELLVVKRPKLLAVAPHVLKLLYETDVLDEDDILTWNQQPPEASWLVSAAESTRFRKKVKPIIEWLKTADEEEGSSSSDDDDDDDEEDDDGDEEDDGDDDGASD